MGPGGRPPKWNDPQVRQDLLAAIENNLTYELACDYAGITYTTLKRWRAAARDGTASPELARFCASIKKAEATAALNAAKAIKSASRDTVWQNHAWLLERRHGYIRRDKVEHAGKVGIGVGDIDALQDLIGEAAQILNDTETGE